MLIIQIEALCSQKVLLPVLQAFFALDVSLARWRTSSSDLLIAAGLLLSGILVYSIKYQRHRSKEDDLIKMLMKTVKILQLSLNSKFISYDLKDLRKVDEDLEEDFHKLFFYFGWCFVTSWFAAGTGLIGSVLAWAVSNKITEP